MKITDYSLKDSPSWVISNGGIFVNFDKVVMDSPRNLFLYNHDQYVCLVDESIMTEALERMQELGINVIDGRVKANA
jgi:hypothetical protein